MRENLGEAIRGRFRALRAHFMKTLKSLVTGVALLTGLFLFGCNGSENNSPTSATSPAANGQVEGQLVADAGASFAKSTLSLQAVNAAQVYPLSGVTVELVRNGAVVAGPCVQ